MGEPAPSSGTKVYIGTTATDAATDTYTQIGLLNALGEYGVEHAEVTFEDLSNGVVLKNKGARNDGALQITVGKDVSDAGQKALSTAALDKYTRNFKVEYNDAVPPKSFTVTISNASPAVVTKTAHGLAVDTPVSFSTTGGLPTGLTAATTYYVKTVPDADTFTVSATKGGSAINTTGAGTGTHTCTTVPAPSYDLMKGKVMSNRKNPGNLNSNVLGTASISLQSGTLTEVPRLPETP